MHAAYNNIYRELVARYEALQLKISETDRNVISFQIAAHDPFNLVLDVLRRGVDEIPPPKTLRADGILFLMINLHQLVTLPLSDRESPQKIYEDTVNGLRDDVRRILRAAIAAAGNRNEITAGHVLRGTAQVLDQLTLKSWKLWD